MESISLAIHIYAMGFIISFLLAVMIKGLMFSIRHFSRENDNTGNT